MASMVAHPEQKKNGPEERTSDPLGPGSLSTQHQRAAIPGATRSTARNLRVRATEFAHGDHSSSGVPAPRANPIRAIGSVGVRLDHRVSNETLTLFVPAPECSPAGPTLGFHPSGKRPRYHRKCLVQLVNVTEHKAHLEHLDFESPVAPPPVSTGLTIRGIRGRKPNVVRRGLLHRTLVMRADRIEE